jgi:hypothetical protein
VFCRKSVLVTRHQGLCPTCDKAEKGRNTEIQPRFRPFRRVFAFFASPPRFTTKYIKNCPFGPYRVCRKFYLVTVTGRLCRSVELIQRVTVTGECRIDRNGTVITRLLFTRSAAWELVSNCHQLPIPPLSPYHHHGFRQTNATASGRIYPHFAR